VLDVGILRLGHSERHRGNTGKAARGFPYGAGRALPHMLKAGSLMFGPLREGVADLRDMTQ